ncbi:lipoate-protein ligase [Anaeramoeba ignava]|uniref:lipoate--protein ligase n=1 Tax=Anaeramoeba ignava TaxID=1746090 RepID=A0A9Q0R9G3_ANAIG|nr:lipoate-protein ligase [Anaeramoeba ignava]
MIQSLFSKNSIILKNFSNLVKFPINSFGKINEKIIRNFHSEKKEEKKQKKKTPVKVFISKFDNPFWNLATEEWLLLDNDPHYRTLFLWRNSPTVVIGKHQNPWKECNLSKMEQNQVFLSRRKSGGGAVYQDLGNTNFTFLSAKEDYAKEINSKIICDSIAKFGVKAEISGRNDITVNGMKISGSAYKITPDRAFHHGTLMISVDLNALSQYLTVNKEKLKSKGVDSVRSRVTNLSSFSKDITHDSLSKSIIQTFFDFYNSECQIQYLDQKFVDQEKKIKEYYEFLQDWNWRFGATPRFSHEMSTRFDWGLIDIYLCVNQGIIEEAKIYSDALYSTMIDELTKFLTGVPYTKAGIRSAIKQASQSTQLEMPKESQKMIQEFGDWLIKKI